MGFKEKENKNGNRKFFVTKELFFEAANKFLKKDGILKPKYEVMKIEFDARDHQTGLVKKISTLLAQSELHYVSHEENGLLIFDIPLPI